MTANGTDGDGARARLLDSATEEFAKKGLAGARVDEIARAAGANKQLVYHYFGNKEGLYAEVLAAALRRSRAGDAALELEQLPPKEAFRAFIAHMIETSLADRRYQRLLLDANLYEGRHLALIGDPAVISSRRLTILKAIMDRGAADGSFQGGLDTRELYMSILGVLSVRTSNAFSLSATIGADLLTPEGKRRSYDHAIEFILRSVAQSGINDAQT